MSGSESLPVMPSIAVSFDAADVAYRRAKATAARARDMAEQHASTGRIERRLREIDAVFETIVLAQAACEGWIYRAYRRVNVAPGEGGGWVKRWTDAPAMICDRNIQDGEQPTRSLDDSTVVTLRRLSAWRNFLLHGDERAHNRLHATVGPGTEMQQLTADFAKQLLADTDAAFDDAGSLLGAHYSPGLSTDFLWVAADE